MILNGSCTVHVDKRCFVNAGNAGDKNSSVFVTSRNLMLPIESKSSSAYLANPVMRGCSLDSIVTTPSSSGRSRGHFKDEGVSLDPTGYSVMCSYESDNFGDNRMLVRKNVRFAQQSSIVLVNSAEIEGSPHDEAVSGLMMRLSAGSPMCVDTVYVYEKVSVGDESPLSVC